MSFWKAFARLQGRQMARQFTKVQQWNPSESSHWWSLIVSFALHIRAFVKGLRKTGNIAGVVQFPTSWWRNCLAAAKNCSRIWVFWAEPAKSAQFFTSHEKPGRFWRWILRWVIFCPWLWNWPAISSTRSTRNAVTAMQGYRWVLVERKF